MGKTTKVLIATALTIGVGSGVYTYKTIDDLKNDNKRLHIQLDKKDTLLTEQYEKIKQLQDHNSDLDIKLSNKIDEVNQLNTVIKSKDVSIESLKQQLEKATKRNESPTINNKVLTSMNMELTFYTNHPSENGTYGGKVVTRTGYDITNTITYQGMGIVAADTSKLPLYSIINIEGLGRFIVLDTGSAIKGNILDVLVASKEEAYQRGRYTAQVDVLRYGKE